LRIDSLLQRHISFLPRSNGFVTQNAAYQGKSRQERFDTEVKCIMATSLVRAARRSHAG
jgi:hypothetical protein